MNRTALIRSLSLGLATLVIASGSIAADDQQLSAARELAQTDSQVATQLQSWIDQRDIALMAQADGLITNDMRASAEQYAIAHLVEADGLISAQLREAAEQQMVASIAAADGLVIGVISAPDTSVATRSPSTLLVAAGGR
jgi:hypothetical protein